MYTLTNIYTEFKVVGVLAPVSTSLCSVNLFTSSLTLTFLHIEKGVGINMSFDEKFSLLLLPGVWCSDVVRVEKSMKECINYSPLVFTEHSCSSRHRALSILIVWLNISQVN